MEVKIGIHSVPRELIVETETPQEDIERELTAALGSGSLFTLDVVKGGRVLVPADKIAYLEFIGPESRRVGFGNITLSFCLRRTFPHIPGQWWRLLDDLGSLCADSRIQRSKII